MGVYNFGWGFADPFLSLYLKEFTDQYTVIGFLFSLMSVVMISMLFIVGPLLDRCRHQTLIDGAKVGYFFVGLLYFLAGEWSSLSLLVVAIILNGALVPLVWTGTLSTLEEYSNERDTTLAFGLYATTRQVLWGAGLAISLWVVWQFPLHYIFIPVMIFPLVSILVTRKIQEKNTQSFFSALRSVIVQDRILLRTIRELKLFGTELRWAFLLVPLCYVIYMLGMTYIPLYAQSNGYNHVETGFLILIMTIPFAFSFLTAEIADHSERFRNIVIGALVASVALFGVAVWGGNASWYLFGWAFLLMAGFAMIEPSLSAIISMLAPKRESGTSSEVIDLMTFGSVTLFSPLMGFLADGFGWERAFLAGSVFCLLLAILTFAIRLHFKKENLLYRLHNPHEKHNPFVL
jgi:MFS family permease